MDYSCIVFDTAPTGHTLRLLQFPTTLQKGLSKLMGLKGMLGGLMSSFGSMFGGASGDDVQGQLLGKLEQLKVGGIVTNHLPPYPSSLTLYSFTCVQKNRVQYICYV